MLNKKQNPVSIPYFERINAWQRLLICVAIATIVYFIAEIDKIDTLTHFMIGWDAFSLSMIIMSWITFTITNPSQIREQSKVQDSSRPVIFIIVLIATLASILAVLILLVTRKHLSIGASWRLTIAITGMLFSWFLIHTIFTLRYAHIYYGDHKVLPDEPAGGLEFPGTTTPEYLDFAYFSFVLGMTFQVSDVQITSKRLRNFAMWHGLFSFGFNTIMIALTINLIAGFN
ncbi:MAG: DUF1345 domain-containing protein [Bacteroidota bacterium]|nr:DUF1345 domain-containing protein [Bacteroidota bacterium]